MQSVMIESVNIPVLEVNGERVMTMSDVDRVHGRQKGTASTRFQRNKERFIAGKDYYETTLGHLHRDLMVQNTFKGRPNIKTFLLTKSGYLMIVKMLNDDKAWEVQRRLVDCYFDSMKAKEEIAAENPMNRIADAISGFAATMERQNELLGKLIELVILQGNAPKAEAPAIEVKTEQEAPKVETETPKAEVKKKRKWRWTNADNQLVPAEYTEWKRELNSLIDGCDKASAIKAACDRLHKVYGISWTDERTNFFRANDRIPVDGNLELAFNIEKRNGWKNIFVNAICDVADSYRKADEPIHYPAETMTDVKGIISAIAKKRNGDPRGLYLYHELFSNFAKETGFDFAEAEASYRTAAKYWKSAKPKRLDVIAVVGRDQFITWFNQYIKKDYEAICA